MGYQRVNLGSTIPLNAQLGDGEANLYPVATVRDVDGVEVADSPFDLVHVADGFYLNQEFVPDTQGAYFSTYIVYTDVGHTTESDYPRGSDIFDVITPESSGTLGTELTAIVEPGEGLIHGASMSCGDETASLTIVTGEDRDIALRLLDASENPFSLTGATEITARFKNADGSVLERKLTTAGITVTNAEGGRLSISMTDTQSALLKTGSNQSFTVIIDIGSVRRKVNFDKVLTVIAASV